MSVTIRDVASRAGVSISTASRALNNKEDVSQAVRLRVLAIAQELNYTANPHARALVAGGSRSLGLVIGNTSAPFLNTVVMGILDTVSRCGYSIIVYNTDEEPERELLAHQRLIEERVIGVLVTSVQSGGAPLRRLTEEGIPFVLVNRRLDDLDADYTLGDLRDGLRQLVHHLYQLGHRRIAYLAGRMDRWAVRERLIGYQQALAELGITYDPQLVPSSGDMGRFNTLVEQVMRVDDPPTAIFSYNDWYTLSALRGLRDLGLRVPEDVSVVGYDDLEIARYIEPPLTTMIQQAYDIGQAGAQLLVDRLNQPANEPWTPRHLVFKPELVVRASSGPAPARG